MNCQIPIRKSSSVDSVEDSSGYIDMYKKYSAMAKGNKKHKSVNTRPISKSDNLYQNEKESHVSQKLPTTNCKRCSFENRIHTRRPLKISYSENMKRLPTVTNIISIFSFIFGLLIGLKMKTIETLTEVSLQRLINFIK